MQQASFDVVVIGSGSAGFEAALMARKQGAKVCLIEKDRLGGECPNWACVPTKALLKAAGVYRSARSAESFGVSTGAAFDFEKIMDYRRRVVERITGGGERGDRYQTVLKGQGIDVKFGMASFLDPHTLSIAGNVVSAKAVVIATGTEERIPPILGLADIPYLTFRSAIALPRLPKSLAIIGAGPVGCEFATFYASLGTRVLLFQSAERVLPREDADVSAVVESELKRLGVEVVCAAIVKEAINARGGVYGLAVETHGETRTHAADAVLLAAGRRANTGDLNLAKAGVKLTERGDIRTNDRAQTIVKHIFAAGDVDGGYLFTHTATAEGASAGYNAACSALNKRGGYRTVDERVVPRVTFVQPEAASVGLTADEVKKEHGSALVGRFDLAGLGRSVTEQVTVGLVKIVAHPDTREVLGCHIVGERAGELIHEAALAMQLHAPVDAIAEMIHAYPTFSEALCAAAGNMKRETGKLETGMKG